MSLRISAFAFLFLLSSCSTHQVTMKYEPTGQIVGKAPGQVSVSVGTFTDERGGEANYLGAIRDRYYIPFKTLRTEKPISEMVGAAFTEALLVRNILGKDSTVAIEGKITKFDANYSYTRTSSASLRVTVVLLPSRALLFSNVYNTENSEWGGSMVFWEGPVFANTDSIVQFAQKTLNETIDKALSDPGLLAAIAQPPRIVEVIK